MPRVLAAWERCDQQIGGRYSLTGMHTWAIVNGEVVDKRRTEEVRCNRCKSLAPAEHRQRLYDSIKAALDVQKEQRRASALWRKATRGR